MRSVEDEPLPFAVWLAEATTLSDFCTEASEADEDRAVRRAFWLFKHSVPAIRSLADPYLEESVVELVLQRDGAEAAFRLVAGERASFTVTPLEGDASRVVAEIAFDGERPTRGEGSSPALAMIAAWATYLTTPG
jgi:hypothetical protein